MLAETERDAAEPKQNQHTKRINFQLHQAIQPAACGFALRITLKASCRRWISPLGCDPQSRSLAPLRRFRNHTLIVGKKSACKDNGEVVPVLTRMREHDLEADVGQDYTSNCFISSRLIEPKCAQCRILYRYSSITRRIHEFVLPRVKQLRLRLWNTQMQ